MITDKYKLHEVAKDLNVNSKEVIDLLNKHSDTPKKAQTALTNEELNLVFEHYTQNNQVKDFDEYFASGKTEKPTPKKEETKEATASKPVNTVQQQEENMDNKQNKQPQEQQPTAQTKPQEQPVAAQNKVQAESAPVAQQPKAKEQAPVTAPAAVKTVTEAPSTIKTPTDAPAAPAAPSTPAAPAATTATPAAPAPKQRVTFIPNTNKAPIGGPRPQSTYNRPAGQTGDRPQSTYNRPAGQTGDRPQSTYNRPAGQTGDRPQSTYNRPAGQTGDRPQSTYNRPAGQTGDRPQSTYNRPYGQSDRPQGGGYNNDRPQGGYSNNRPQGQNGSRPPFRSNNGSAPQYPQTTKLNRSITPKRPPDASAKPFGAPVAAPIDEVNAAGKNIRHVDTRAANVDLDKYNERYETIAPTNMAKKDTGVKKQKFGSKATRKPFMSKRDKELDKIKKLEMERQRRQKLQITLPDEITVGDLALKLKVTSAEVIKRLMMLDVMATITEVIDFETASMVAVEIGAKVEREVVVSIEERLFDVTEDSDENLVSRPPVVVVMGHVDHGKTSILDAIRKAKVTSTEAGGITQHIGAYQVMEGDRAITFLDTPGHEAFTAMRARGAKTTDIAILVVAADDGIMPQTVESINHAKAAGLAIIVAINKIDKPAANIEKVKQELTEYELVPEEWGGDVICVPVSAKTGEGIDQLLEMVLLTADVKELKANPDRQAKGTVIEARLDKGRGPIATILIQTGTLNNGDAIIAGTAVGRVRVMTNDRGEKIEHAGPSMPVEITGLAEVPAAGDEFNAVEDERLARELVSQRRQEAKEEQFNSYSKVTLENLFAQIEQGEMKELPIIVKADVQGSAEALKQSLEKLSNEEVRVSVIHSGVGTISKSDIMLANASNAIVIGFNVRPDTIVQEEATLEGVDIRLYRIIYDAINEIETALKGMLAPKYRDVEQGKAEIRQVYKITNSGMVAGVYVTEGKITRNSKIRVVREGIIVADVELNDLKRFKDSVKEVAKGFECGMSLVKYADLKEGDIFEAYITEEYRD